MTSLPVKYYSCLPFLFLLNHIGAWFEKINCQEWSFTAWQLESYFTWKCIMWHEKWRWCIHTTQWRRYSSSLNFVIWWMHYVIFIFIFLRFSFDISTSKVQHCLCCDLLYYGHVTSIHPFIFDINLTLPFQKQFCSM